MFIVSAISVISLSASLATDYWVVAYPRKRVDRDTEKSAINVTGGDLDTKFRGYIHFGLFHGYKSLDHGLGVRQGEISTTSEVMSQDLFDFGLWVSIILFVALAIALNLIGCFFAVLNATLVPVETLAGPLGLYLWNAMAALLSLLAIIMCVALYFLEIKKNVLTREDREVYQWTSTNFTLLHFSFYGVVFASVLSVVNTLIVSVTSTRCPLSWRKHSSGSDKVLDGVMMY